MKRSMKNKFVKHAVKSKQKSKRENAMTEDILGFPAMSSLTSPFQLMSDSQYNPITLNRVLLSYSYITFGIIQTFIDQPVEDAFRGHLDIETDELEEDDLDMLQEVLVECGDYREMKDAMKWARLFGGAGLIANTDQDPESELDFDLIDEDSPLSFIAADRWELQLQYLADDKVATPYNYYGQALHKTRVMKIKGKEAPSFIRQRLQGWGMSELERTIRDVNSYAKNQDVIYELLDEAKIDVMRLVGFNRALMNNQSNGQLTNRLNIASQTKNYQRALVMDKEDEFDQKQISFSGLAEMQNQNRIGVAASIRMPMTKLFGLSAAGFSSGEDDIENYNSIVDSEIRARAHEIVRPVIKMRCKQLFGFIPESLEIKFKPLRILSAEQEENVKDKKFQRGSAHYAQGMFNGKEYAEYLKKENVITMETEVSKGIREPEPPSTPSLTIDMPQKVVKPKAEVGRN